MTATSGPPDPPCPFDPPGPAGPTRPLVRRCSRHRHGDQCAETPAERRALLRKGNLATVEQVRAFYARPWAEGDADSIDRGFICECGGTACDASVVLTVGAVAAEPALAPGHAPVR